MIRTLALAAAAAAGVWWLLARSDRVQTAEGELGQQTDADGFEFLTNPFTEVQDMLTPTDEDQAAQNVAAFLFTIRKAEGTAGANGYRTLFGGGLFDNGFVDHPRIAKRYGQLWTSAAGAYQFMAVSPIPDGSGKSTRVNTWDRIQKSLGLPDFSPASQDAAAVELIREAGALGDVRAGRFDQAVSKVRGIWASMPGAGYGQPEKTLAALRDVYIDNGGALA